MAQVADFISGMVNALSMVKDGTDRVKELLQLYADQVEQGRWTPEIISAGFNDPALALDFLTTLGVLQANVGLMDTLRKAIENVVPA